MFAILKIRIIQIVRELKATGPVTLLLAALFVFLTYAAYLYWQNPSTALYTAMTLLSSCLFFQMARKDKLFIYFHLSKPHLTIFMEYLALIFPFAITSLLTKNWFYFPILIGMLWFVPFFKYNYQQKTTFRKISTLIPASAFEWISGLRRTYLYLAPLYILSWGFCWFNILPLIFLWMITVGIASFYNECEQLQILYEDNKTSRQLLKRKLLVHTKYLLYVIAPVLIVNIFFVPEHWWINLLFLCAQISTLCFAICFKYSAFVPGKMPYGDNIILSMVSFCNLVPYLLPVPIIMASRYYFKAIKHLNFYFND